MDIGNSPEAIAEQILIQNPVFARIVAESTGTPIRQELMKRLREATGRHVITYITPITVQGNQITPDDIAPFHSILSTIPAGEPIDFLINSPGGIPDTAEKIVALIRDRQHPFRAAVANYAKSAATLICLGADSILMGDPSELGPTDPQIPRMQQGTMTVLPAHAYLDAHREIVDRINTSAPNVQPADILQLQQMDPAFIKWCRQSVDASRDYAERWLREYMFKASANPQGDAERVAKQLAESRDYLSHGRMIDHKQAAGSELGLKIDYLPPGDQVWEWFWELYCRSELFLRQTQNTKLYESETGTMAMAVRTP